MANPSEIFFDVNENDFQHKVLAASHTTPVVVDFWAEWCGPCRVLGPILEKVVAGYKGKVLLAKVNTGENHSLSMQFGIHSIPAVKIFKDGQVVKEFVGALPEQQIDAVIKSVAGDEVEDALRKAAGFLENGKNKKAKALYYSVLESNPAHSGALVGLARVFIMDDDFDRARQMLKTVDEGDAAYDEASSLLMLLDFYEVCEKAGGREKCQKLVQSNPEDIGNIYKLGCCYTVENSYPEALDSFLSILRRDKDFGDGKAKAAMLSIFSTLGQTSEITREYRGKLAQVLF